MPNFNDEDRDSSTDDDWDASSSDEEKKPAAKKRRIAGEEDWRATARADRWFSQDIFSGITKKAEDAEDKDGDDNFDEEDVGKDDEVEGELSDDDLPQVPLTDKQKRAKKRKKQQKRLERAGVIKPKEEKEEMEIVPEVEPTPLDAMPGKKVQKPTDPQELAETLAMGSLMIQKKSRMDLIDSAFNRWTFDGEDNAVLPSWFLDEENKFNKPELPVSKELMTQFRDKLKQINARPIRKVLEAQGRKRKRLNQRIEKLRKTAQQLMETPDMSDFAKANQMKKMVSKLRRDDSRPVSYVALKKGGGGRKVDKSKAPKGAKVKVVDRRMKKDIRANRRTLKKMSKTERQKKGSKTSKKRSKGRYGPKR